MSTTVSLFTVRAPVRASVAAPRAQTKRSALACRASAKESSAAMKAEDFKCPLACGLADDAEDKARVEMAKAKCVHPDRPVGKACKDCPRR